MTNIWYTPQLNILIKLNVTKRSLNSGEFLPSDVAPSNQLGIKRLSLGKSVVVKADS